MPRPSRFLPWLASCVPRLVAAGASTAGPCISKHRAEARRDDTAKAARSCRVRRPSDVELKSAQAVVVDAATLQTKRAPRLHSDPDLRLPRGTSESEVDCARPTRWLHVTAATLGLLICTSGPSTYVPRLVDASGGWRAWPFLYPFGIVAVGGVISVGCHPALSGAGRSHMRASALLRLGRGRCCPHCGQSMPPQQRSTRRSASALSHSRAGSGGRSRRTSRFGLSRRRWLLRQSGAQSSSDTNPGTQRCSLT